MLRFLMFSNANTKTDAIISLRLQPVDDADAAYTSLLDRREWIAAAHGTLKIWSLIFTTLPSLKFSTPKML
jgi:hypothetical protein